MIQVQHQVQQHCNRRNKNPGKMEYGRLSKVKKIIIINLRLFLTPEDKCSGSKKVTQRQTICQPDKMDTEPTALGTPPGQGASWDTRIWVLVSCR